jgi:hypothetical protein
VKPHKTISFSATPLFLLLIGLAIIWNYSAFGEEWPKIQEFNEQNYLELERSWELKKQLEEAYQIQKIIEDYEKLKKEEFNQLPDQFVEFEKLHKEMEQLDKMQKEFEELERLQRGYELLKKLQQEVEEFEKFQKLVDDFERLSKTNNIVFESPNLNLKKQGLEPVKQPNISQEVKSFDTTPPHKSSKAELYLAFNETVLQAQRKLKELGYNPGPIDGLMGSKTKAAIRIFQSDYNLPKSGTLDKKTRAKLGILKSSKEYVEESSGTAPCTIPDGHHTVHFSNGATYTGKFKNCRPLSCNGIYTLGGKTYKGYFESDGVNTVTLKTGGTIIKIKLILGSAPPQ